MSFDYKLPNPFGHTFCFPYYYLIIPMITGFFVRFLFNVILNMRWHLRNYGSLTEAEKLHFNTQLFDIYRSILSNIHIDNTSIQLFHNHNANYIKENNTIPNNIYECGTPTPITDSGSNSKAPLQLVIHSMRGWSMNSITLTETNSRAESNIEMARFSAKNNLDIKHDFIPKVIIDEVLSFLPLPDNVHKCDLWRVEEQKRAHDTTHTKYKRMAYLLDIPLGIYALSRLISIVACLGIVLWYYVQWYETLKSEVKHFNGLAIAMCYMPSLKMNGFLIYMDIHDLRLKKPCQEQCVSKPVEIILWIQSYLDAILIFICSILCSPLWVPGTIVFVMIPCWFIVQCTILYHSCAWVETKAPTMRNKWIRDNSENISYWGQCFLSMTQIVLFFWMIGVGGCAIMDNKGWKKALRFTLSGEYCNEAMASDVAWDWTIHLLIVSWIIY